MIVPNVVTNLTEKYRQDKNILGIMLFGSFAREKSDEYSDIDIYILWDKKKLFSRKNFVDHGIRVDIIADTIQEARQYLKEDSHNVRRNTSHMLAHGKVLVQRNNKMTELQQIAKKNLRLSTKYSADEILMHKYSIDDFWGEVQRDLKARDSLAFVLDSQLLLGNIIEMFLKLHKTFFRQPNEMKKVLFELDSRFARMLESFYTTSNTKKQKEILEKLVKYIYDKSDGQMPDSWVTR